MASLLRKLKKQKKISLPQEPLLEIHHKNAMVGTLLELGIGGVALISVFVFVPGVFEFIAYQLTNVSTKVVCYIIFGLLLVGIYLTLRSLTIINYEYANLMEVFSLARKIKKDSRRKIPCAEFFPSSASGVVFEKLEGVFRMAQEGGGEIPHDSLADILITKASTQDEIPAFLAGSMTMVGLIGTIIGLMATTQGMQTLFTSIGDLSALKQGFSEALVGIDIAFFTTLCGAVCMLIQKYLNIIVRKARLVFFSELEEVLLTEILPKIHKMDFTSLS